MGFLTLVDKLDVKVLNAINLIVYLTSREYGIVILFR